MRGRRTRGGTRPRRLWGALAAAILLAACTTSPPKGHAAGGPASTPVPSPPATTTAPSPPPAPSPSPLPPRFVGTVSVLPGWLAAKMRGTTWRPGCPVPLRDLRLLRLRYWGFDGEVHQGPMVVNASVAADVVGAFRRIFQARFPINRMHLTVKYVPGHDDPNDRRDWTAGFNCRVAVTARGPLSNWSQHAYGLAIDVNPMQNPYVTFDGYIHNVHARRYRNRAQHLKGMIHAGDAVVRAFESIGWTWAGGWSHDKDYMHFSQNGT